MIALLIDAVTALVVIADRICTRFTDRATPSNSPPLVDVAPVPPGSRQPAQTPAGHPDGLLISELLFASAGYLRDYARRVTEDRDFHKAVFDRPRDGENPSPISYCAEQLSDLGAQFEADEVTTPN